MSLIEGIGDEVTHFFIALLAVIFVCIAWWSTNISEQRQFRTVLLLDRRRRTTRSIVRVRLPRRLSNHTETVTISEGTSTSSTTQSQREEEVSQSSELEHSTPQAAQAQPKPNIEPSPSTLVEDNSSDSSEGLEGRLENRLDLNHIEEVEERDIIETMDADTQSVLRQRRLAHFEGGSENISDTLARQSHESQLPQMSNNVDSIENLEIKDKSVRETETIAPETESQTSENQPNITIKLKFINDDIKIVDGRLEELLGDFKKRHFEQEINTNKIVRLIFNGQVLKQDRHTLQSCGLFDNCVVHCLIHQKRPSLNESHQSQDSVNTPNAELFRDHPFVGVTNLNNNNQGIDWDLGNFLFALVSFILLAAWYFRYVYAHLYTVTATVGLIIITGVFSIVVIGTYFPDTEIPDTNTRIRIARAERIEVQQQ